MAYHIQQLGHKIYPTIHVGESLSLIQSARLAIATKLYQISYKMDKDLWAE